jgi:hypothetical protein
MLKLFRLPIIVTVLALAFIAPALALAQEGTTVIPAQPSITVSGTGTASGAPDIAYITLGAEARDPNPATAFNQANDTVRAIRDALAGLNIAPEDIQTSSFNMWAQDIYDAGGNATGERTYFVQNVLSIKVREIERAAEAIRTAVDAGANVIQGLSFGVADPNTLMSEARAQAIADARARAEQLAAGLGVQVGDVIAVVEGVLPAPGPLANARMDVMAGDGGAAQVAPGSFSVTVNISVSFAIAR